MTPVQSVPQSPQSPPGTLARRTWRTCWTATATGALLTLWTIAILASAPRDAGSGPVPTFGGLLEDVARLFPVCFLASVVAIIVARRRPARFVVLLGFGTAALVQFGAQFDTWSFSEVPRVGVASLAATMPAALLAAFTFRASDRALARARSTSARRVRARAVTSVVVLVVLSGAIAALVGLPMRAAAVADLAPCPAGAQEKVFDIAAIDVDITLNRFGDHDPIGKMYVLEDRIDDVRDEEATGKVSIGLGDDAIQPLVVRANVGDCVVINFRNATTGEFGVHIDGLVSRVDSSGDQAGRKATSSVPGGGTRTYRYYIPDDPALEGAHYMRPGAGNREAIAHGLFGALVAEPAGSTYLDPATGVPIESGWTAIIKPPGKRAFREFTRLYHEVGNEGFQILDAEDDPVDVVDPHTGAYRPGTRAINYRSEPFMNRLERSERQKSPAYNSFTFGDPATPIMQSYLGEPTKLRLVHAGRETFHVFHLHGGGTRWRANPLADDTFDYQEVGRDTLPTAQSKSKRLDSQSFGPGESFNVDVEGGAGGVQQTVGDLLEHCQIAEHYNAGMWSSWRVINTRQPNLSPLPDMEAPPTAIDSDGLVDRTMPDGTTLDPDNLDTWTSSHPAAAGRLLRRPAVARSSGTGSRPRP